MLTSIEIENKLQRVWRAHDLAGFESQGRRETLKLTGVRVGCVGEPGRLPIWELGEVAIADVVLRVDVNEHGHGTLRIEMSAAPERLRQGMRSATWGDAPALLLPKDLTFEIRDGDVVMRVDPSALQVIEVDTTGPFAIKMVGENIRALVPWPVRGPLGGIVSPNPPFVRPAEPGEQPPPGSLIVGCVDDD